MKVSGFRFQVSVLTALVLLCAPAYAGDVAQHWQVLPEKSAIEWTASYGGKPVSGSFPAYTADIAFDTDHLEASRVVIKLELAKVKSSDHDAQESLPGSDWFDAAQHPQAVFESTVFKRVPSPEAATANIKAPMYQMDGNLTVRAKTVPVTLPFTVTFSDDAAATPPVRYAHMQGETTIKRTALGVGQGDWSQTDSVADDVKITIRLEAKQLP